jgi:thiol-disulfide isomerase/thioredoxin
LQGATKKFVKPKKRGLFTQKKTILKIIALLFLSIPLITSAKSTTNWLGKLHISSTVIINFDIKLEEKNNFVKIILPNGGENILIHGKKINDSLVFTFDQYNTHLVFKESSNELKGYWVNLNKKNYRIPFSACRFKKETKLQGAYPIINGKYETYFDLNTPDVTPGLGVFKQKGNLVSGTFLTETGDYRYLTGQVKKDSTFAFGCFDGAHAFWFAGKMKRDSLIGHFYSGTHSYSTFHSRSNPEFELKDPTKITFEISNNAIINLSALDTSKIKNSWNNASFLGKVTVIQIMGTWCPNCLDETNFLVQLKKRNPSLSIIGFAYENGIDTSKQLLQLKKYSKKLNLNYPTYLAGTASKTIATQQFNFLTEISSFPTTIVIGKDGKIAKIYTGFSGPATGKYYSEYEKEFSTLIETLSK